MLRKFANTRLKIQNTLQGYITEKRACRGSYLDSPSPENHVR